MLEHMRLRQDQRILEQPVTENPVADATLGGNANRVTLMGNLNRATTALVNNDQELLHQELANARTVLGTVPGSNTKRTAIKKAFCTSVAQHAQFAAATTQTKREKRIREQHRQEQADHGDGILRAVVAAIHEVGSHQWEPDKIVLQPKHFDQILELSSNIHSGYLPMLLDSSLTQETTLFGFPVEKGPKSQIVVNPEFQLFTAPGIGPDGTLGVVACNRTVREPMTVPIYLGFLFRGHIITKNYRGVAVNKETKNELSAIDTLREMISETEYRRYVKYGFITVQGKSGNIYQIFRNQAHTKVWRGGVLVEEVCVRIKPDFKVPPTDNVIAFKTMIEADEEEFLKIGNRYKNLNRQVATA